MPNPLLIAGGAQLGGYLLNKFMPKEFGGQTQFNMLNPADYKDQITYSPADLARIRASAGNEVHGALSESVQHIKQVGSAGRLPEGAVLQGIGGATEKAAEGLSKIEPQLAEMKRSGLMDYLRMQQYYDQLKMGHATANANQNANVAQQAFGGLANLATLWAGGAFDKK